MSLLHELHYGTGRGRVDDAVLERRIAREIWAQMLVAEKIVTRPLAYYILLGSGVGKMRWFVREPPRDQNEAMIRVAREIDTRLRPNTAGSWAVGLGDWNVLAQPEPRYDQTFFMWIDAQGDIPVSIDCEDPPEVILADIDHIMAQCDAGLRVRYPAFLRAADIRPEHMAAFAAAEPDPRAFRH